MLLALALFVASLGGVDEVAYEGTPAAEQIEELVLDRWPGWVVQVGQYNRRPISGTSTWSQHSWGNAVDFHLAVGRPANATEKARGDTIAAYLRKHQTELGIRTILWWVKDHWDHIHVDFWPKGIGTPPLSSTGVGTFQYANGTQISARIQLVPPEATIGDEDMAIVIQTLKGQNMAYYRSLKLKTGAPGGNPDYWGSDYAGSPKPSQAEWEAAAPTLLGASLQAGVFHDSSDHPAPSTVDNVARATATAAQSSANLVNTKVENLRTHLRES